MRVISGKYKGKKLDGFDIDGTRPTMDRVKESLFGSIQKYIKDSVVLDLFAGSGSLGIEALSNGASVCYFVDNSPKINSILKNNLSNISNTYQIKSDYQQALLSFKNQQLKFDLIFLDPPYKANIIQDALNKIEDYNLLRDNGIIVCEYEQESFTCEFANVIKEKKYGSTNIIVFQKR